LAAMDERTLMVMDGPRVRLFSAADGKPGAEIAVAAAGEFLGAQFDRSRQICALFGTTDNGRIFILKSGQVVADFPVAQGGDRFSGEFHLSEDGRYIAATANCTLRFYSVEKGLLWTFSGDEQLRSPHVSSPDGRVAVSSALGTLSVFSADGHRLLERSLGTLCRPFWLPDGDLLIASWIGPVFRLDKEYKEKWRAWLIPTEPDMREKILAKDTTPTAHIPDWSNAEAKPAAITPNLLAQTPVKMSAPGIRGGLVNKPELLFDGLSAPPPRPWLDWSGLNYACENFANTILEFDAQGKLLEVSAVTFFENPDQPQSWLRDVALQYWNPEKNFWEHAVTCRADAPVHTHRLAAPVTGGKFRLVLKPGSNPRLAEVVLHGTLRAAAAPAPASGGRASAPVGPPSLIDNGNIIR
jgi:hypothetical protein